MTRSASSRGRSDHPLGELVRETAGLVLCRPCLYWPALLQLFRLAPSKWWRHWPPLPLPDRAWLAFRIETAIGGGSGGGGRGRLSAVEVVEFLEWCRTSGAER